MSNELKTLWCVHRSEIISHRKTLYLCTFLGYAPCKWFWSLAKNFDQVWSNGSLDYFPLKVLDFEFYLRGQFYRIHFTAPHPYFDPCAHQDGLRVIGPWLATTFCNGFRGLRERQNKNQFIAISLPQIMLLISLNTPTYNMQRRFFEARQKILSLQFSAIISSRFLISISSFQSK